MFEDFRFGGCGREGGWGHGAGRGGRGDWGMGPGGKGGFWGIWMGPGMGGPGRAGRGHGRGSRMFGQGDLKYVILQLLDEKPRHGYEIIKELEERFAGAYSPSPGTVYPTLTMLEDLGYARATPEEGGRRIYEITAEGKKYLEENKGTVDDIFERIAEFGAGFFSAPMMEINAAFKHLGWAVYGAAPRHMRDVERLRKIREVLERAAKEIEGLGAAQGSQASPGSQGSQGG